MFRCTTDFHECIFIYDHTKIHLKQQQQSPSSASIEKFNIKTKNRVEKSKMKFGKGATCVVIDRRRKKKRLHASADRK